MESYRLPQDFSLAIIGRQGWENDLSQKIPYALAISFEVLDADIPIYTMISVENEISIPLEVRV